MRSEEKIKSKYNFNSIIYYVLERLPSIVTALISNKYLTEVSTQGKNYCQQQKVGR